METYQGGCHCGAVRFEVEMVAPHDALYRCNCSLCRKKGIIMKPLPQDDFKVLTGEDDLGVYQWNKKIAAHYFCKICGVYTHHRRRRDPTQISINIECLDDIDMPEADIIGLTNGLEHN